MNIHPWHDVSNGDQTPDLVNGIIEIPKNSRAKYELDKESGMLMLDRVLYSSINYPANYGFIPQTYCDDNDPLDILILSQIEIVPMCIVEAKVIGVMRMMDQGEMDDKIIAVAANDMSVNHMNEIEELPDHWLKELRSFFENYKELEHKEVVVEDFQNRQVALEVIQQAIIDYQAKFKS
jgi:inorganic pyrophosphatase